MGDILVLVPPDYLPDFLFHAMFLCRLPVDITSMLAITQHEKTKHKAHNHNETACSPLRIQSRGDLLVPPPAGFLPKFY